MAGPINRLPKYVASTTLDAAPWGEGAAEVVRGPVEDLVARLRDRHASIIVWGSLTLADALFESGQVDVLRLRVVPQLIGGGRSFVPAGTRAALERVATHPHPSGHVTLTYRVRR